MISSGLFVLPGLAFSKAGPSVFLSYFLAGCAALTTVLSLSELITAMPKAGGDYYYVTRSFGQLFGTVSGVLSWLALSLKSAFAILGIAELAYLTFGGNLLAYAIPGALFFTLLNLFGVKEAVKFQIILVVGLLCILAAFFGVSFHRIEMQHFNPFLSHGVNALFSTAGFVFVSFGGVLTTASIAGEIRNPVRNIPLGLIGSTMAVTVLYTLVVFAVVGLLPADTLSQSLAPIALAGRMAGGQVLYYSIMIASLFAFVTTANGGILTASRYPIALASDGMLPGMFSKTSRKTQTPYVAIIATGTMIGIALAVELDLLIKAASTVILLSNVFAHLSVLIMRESTISNYRPTFRAPLYPWLQILGIVIFVFLIVDMGIQPILLSLAFTSIGVVLYFVRRGKMPSISPALVHLVERITDKKLVVDGLSNELGRIVEDRDNIIRDEFDNAIECACFLDYSDAMDIEDFWKRALYDLQGCLPNQLPAERITSLLRTREAESPTTISQFVAIPHIIIEGQGVFKIILVRALKGIRFNDIHPSIKAVFVLIGSRDMRNLHLRALAAIAHIIQHSSFEQEWAHAKNDAEIRDLFFLSKRRRDALQKLE
jgi:amino acid transporter/mannitol/fructose-specific phosphotransferase system IIA component (Ntr-type)